MPWCSSYVAGVSQTNFSGVVLSYTWTLEVAKRVYIFLLL